ncbi:diguanylate cyclase response regulator [Saccharobesus litoralis]|uniref:diguanylate cyclase n=1 Tax=Saccharobesus litoralis TaxID=2172099 RepID=A0A2S0VQF7_9ALTE|nr:diguanylate cyclase [Saccharobesus litoralis]AWB66441.1 diguanylate cyclase response regulator [Saccharobesus litoralis]
MFSILLIDDEADNLAILTSLLKDEYRVFASKSGEEGLELIHTVNPDLILLDILMPNMDGFDVLKRIKSDELTQAIPVIFITGLQSPEDEEKGLRLGATDYIQKPFHHGIVKARVDNTIALVRQTQLLEELALLDSLTELPNRRKWRMESEFAWHKAINRSQNLAIGVIDIDCFKRFNDSYGHAEGDRALKQIARFLKNKLGAIDADVYRYGGEEFVFIIESDMLVALKAELATISQALEQEAYPHDNSTVAKVLTVSVGVYIIKPQPFEEFSDAFDYADKLMYRAKYDGGNQVVIEHKE